MSLWDLDPCRTCTHPRHRHRKHPGGACQRCDCPAFADRPYRLLITGSRDWPDQRAVSLAIMRHLGPDITKPWARRPVVIVHGACPTGADAHAAWFVHENGEHLGITEERHPADWATHGRAAGPIRNAHMVKLGADHCLAFPLGGRGTGTRGTIRLARAAGIPVTVIAPAEQP